MDLGDMFRRYARMREYIFYVLLVFLPIGAFMVRILHDQGLPTKNIAYIVLTSLAIVVTFPISMERLGILLAFTVYAIILFLIILYMVKATDEICLDTVTTRTTPEDKVEGNIHQNQSKDDNIVSEVKTSTILENQLDSVPLDKEEVVNDNITKMVFGEIVKNEEVTNEEETIHKENDIVASDELKLVWKNDNIKDANEAEIKVDSLKEANIEVKEESLEEKLDIENNRQMTSEIKAEQEVESKKEEILIVENMPQGLDKKIIIEDEQVEIPDALNGELVSYIDEAFLYKTEGNLDKAIENFLLIWENTKDYDLKHLVTLELVEMYKTAGLYHFAQELLSQFYDEIKEINTYMAIQLKKELTYIMLLNDEITRLGLEKVPFDKLPRWVKIKVADELNQ